MIRRASSCGLSVLVFAALIACYHATIETGLPASTTVIHEKWASGYLWGLVPPHVVTAAVACPQSKIASVETQHSFLNQLAAIVTLGIYTPIEIKVTCGS
jgi:hypothetical protein